MIEYKLVSFKIQTLQNVFITITCTPDSHSDKAMRECYQISDIDGSWNPNLACRVEGSKEDGKYNLYSIVKVAEANNG
ncbi:MAG TPA: hypothetical protein DDW71_00565 [Lactobacillus sp.]|nr:hypothetical protein [Lactobacillus sp.]